MRFKRVLSGLMAVALAVSMAGCGGGGGGNTAGGAKGEEGTVVASNKAAHYYKAEYLEKLPEEFTDINRAFFVGDEIVYSSYGANYDTPLIGRVNLLTGESSVVWKKEGTDETSITGMGADTEGNVYAFFRISRIKDEILEKNADVTEEDIIKYIYEEWGTESYEEAEKSWNNDLKSSYGDKSMAEIYSMMTADYENDYIREDFFVKYDASGNEVFKNTVDIGADIDIRDVKTDKNGNILVLTGEWIGDDNLNYIQIYNSDGSAAGKVELDTYADRLLTLANGDVAVTSSGETCEIITIDAANRTKGETKTIDGLSYIGNLCVFGENEYLVNCDSYVTRVNTETGEKEKFFTWLDSNIMSYYVRDFGMLSDGGIGVYLESYGAGRSVDLAILREISEEEAAKITPVNVVCFYADQRLQNAALEFNKKHSDYRISITEYFDFSDENSDYQTAMDSFVTDCATDSSIDVVSFPGYSQMLDFADKGLLTDLTPYMEKDELIKKDNIIPGIVSAFTFKDKFVALPSSYRVETLVGKKSVVGDRQGWTAKDCLDAYEKTGALVITPYTDRATIMRTLISLNYDEFIDIENGTCNFNNQDFQDVLALAAKYPEEYVYNEETNQMDDFKTGKQLLYTDSLPEFNLGQSLASICGEDVSYIGYPTSNGNGAMMAFYGMTGITSNCKVPELMWDFMRTMYLPEATESMYGDSEYYNGSILVSELDKYLDGAKNWKNRGEAGYDTYSVELRTPTDEEVETMRTLLNNTTAVLDSVSTSIMNIISEEAAAYFSGEKTAADVAAVVQSRVDIYLSETR